MYVRRLKFAPKLAAFLAASVILTLVGAAVPAPAQTFSVLHNAPGGNGVSYPAAEAISERRNGDMYTTSGQGGTIYGTLFSFTSSGAVSIVDDTDATAENESYSQSTNKWTNTLLSIPQGTMDAASAVDNGQLYCIGGWATLSGSPISNVQIYQP